MRKLGRTSAHRKATLSNLATSLLRHERITTTLPRAKEAKKVVEKLISRAKKDTLSARREAVKVIKDKEVLKKLFSQVGPKFQGRAGGYSRIIKLGQRKGDNAPLVLWELVEKVAPPMKKKMKLKEKPKEEPKVRAKEKPKEEPKVRAKEKPKEEPKVIPKEKPEEKRIPTAKKKRPFFKKWFRFRGGG